VSQYQKKHSPTHTYTDHQSSFICFLHLLQSVAISLFNLRAWHFFWHNHCPSLLWSTSWSGTLHFILHTFLHPITVLFATHAHTNATYFAVVPRLCHLILVSLSTLYLRTLIFYLNATLPLSSLLAEVLPHFLFLQARSHFHATYYFAHNRCTISVSLWMTTLLVSYGTNCLNLFHPIQILASTTEHFQSPSTFNTSLKKQNLSTDSRFALTQISTLVWSVLVTGFTQLLQINDFITLDMLLLYILILFYITTFLVYPLLTTSTLYWIITYTSTTDTTWPLAASELPSASCHGRVPFVFP